MYIVSCRNFLLFDFFIKKITYSLSSSVRVIKDGDIPKGLADPPKAYIRNLLFHDLDNGERVDVHLYVVSTQAWTQNWYVLNIHKNILSFGRVSCFNLQEIVERKDILSFIFKQVIHFCYILYVEF